MATITKVENPSRPGDVVVQFYTRKDYMINPYQTIESFVWRVGIVRTLKRNGRPSRVEWLQGQYDFDRRQIVNLSDTNNYAVASRDAFANGVTDDDIEAAVALKDFSSLDEIRAALAPLRRFKAA